MNIAYPLQWPVGRGRHPSRKTGRFMKYGQRITMDYAVRRLRDELGRINAADAVLSTNQELTKAGWPRADRGVTDPAIAVFFWLQGKAHCMPCDTYDRMPDNIAAVAAHIEATRAIERHGVATVAEMFTGFVALPAPKNWREVLGTTEATREAVERAFRDRAKAAHPDAGGSNAEMAALNEARAAALRELAGA